MTPPQLARNTPVLNIVQPLIVGVDPIFRMEADLAAGDDVERLLRDRLAVCTGLRHRHKPLVGQHRFNDNTRPVAARHLQFVLVGLFQNTQGFQIGDDDLTRFETIQAPVFFRRVIVDLGVQRQNRDQRQVMALAHGVVVEVMRRCHLDTARAEFQIDIAVGDDRNLAIGERQFHHLADQMLITRVIRMHHHGGIAEHGFRACRGHRQ